MFTNIDLSSDLYEEFASDSLKSLSKVNLFIGQNNVGKSRLIRKLFSDGNLGFLPSNLKANEINNITGNFYEGVRKFSLWRGLGQIPPLANALNNYKPIDFITQNTSVSEKTFDWLDSFLKINFVKISGNANIQRFKKDLEELVRREGEMALELLSQNLPRDFSYEYDNIYFPTLRGLRPLIKNKEYDFYLDRTLVDHFSNKEGSNAVSLNHGEIGDRIYTGLTFYDDLKRLKIGRYEEGLKVRKFEEFLSKNFFNNQSIDLIPNIDADVVYIKIGDDDDYPIYNLGDGIQMLIILMYPLFFSEEKSLKVFIEEPELYLHPGMQRILLDVLTNDDLFPEYQFFMSTHSNHFLDMTADMENISIYSLKKKNSSRKFFIDNIEGPDTNVLNILGVKNSSVFLSNCTIWVEGITDRIYIRKYLKVFLAAKNIDYIKEDIHYSIVEYGGGNITHWSFLEDDDPEFPNINVERLCGKLFLVSDQDGAGLKKDGQPNSRKRKKTERHLKLQKKLGERYYCLKSREIENLLTPKVLRTVIEGKEKENSNSLKFNNWNSSKYSLELLGNYIENNVVGLTRKYAADSGTIRDKVNFSKLAVKNIKSVNDMSEEAKLLCQKIYQFIIEENQIVNY